MRYFKLLFLLLLLPFQVLAVGVSVSPAKLEMKVPVREESAAELIIKNVSSDVALFEVYLDDFESFIKIRPASFILESQEQREVSVKINAREAGRYTVKISVVAKSLNKNEFQVGSGIKIPLEVEARENKKFQSSDFILGEIRIIKISPYLAIAFLILLALIGYIYFLKRKIKKLSKPH